MTSKLPSLFISHSAGPMPLLSIDSSNPFSKFAKGSPSANFYKQIAKQLNLQEFKDQQLSESQIPIKTILLVSAHWVTDKNEPLRITSSEHHNELQFDYYGFPKEAYEFKYPVDGNPSTSAKIQSLLSSAGIKSELDTKYRMDHGSFVPLIQMYPRHDIPVIEMSISSSYDPQFHFNVGKALSSLRDEGVLIISSGMTTHDLSMRSTENQAKPFVEKLYDVLTQYDSIQRKEALINWETTLPNAKINHPQADHFTPLFVAVGAAENGKGTRIYQELINSFCVDSYKFE